MKKYAVAKFDAFEGKLTLEIVDAESSLHACCKALVKEDYTHEKAVEDYEDMQNFFDHESCDDFWIDVKEVV